MKGVLSLKGWTPYPCNIELALLPLWLKGPSPLEREKEGCSILLNPPTLYQQIFVGNLLPFACLSERLPFAQSV